MIVGCDEEEGVGVVELTMTGFVRDEGGWRG